MANDFLSFKLPDDFVNSYRGKEVPWGFPIGAGNSLGELTFITKYSRRREDGTKETWVDTSRRVIEGMFSIQKDWCKENRLPWNENKAQATAKDAFDRLFVGKWTPPGRGLWMMGTEFVHAKKNSAALQNCSFLSTEHISTRSVHDATWPFVRLMEMSMLGVGVGFDTKGADKLTIHQPLEEVEVLVVEDSREGWCESVGKLLESYFFAGRPTFDFDYSLVRSSGEPINGFGGTAAGPGPLIDLHNSLKAQFNGREGEKLSSTDIVDIQNKIGKCLTGDTWVLTIDGPRQVRDLVGVKTDLIVNGKAYRMISDGFWKTGEKEVFNLKTDRGYSLSLTAEHQVLTENGWKKAEDIFIGEKIVLHNHESFSWSGTGTQEDGYLLGLLVGDGSIRKVNWGSGELALLFAWEQDKGSEFTKKAIESAMEGRKRRSDAIGWQKNGGEGRWMFQSSSLTELARSYGIVRGNKTITPYVEEASSEFYVGFLRGLFDADASVNPETRTITLHQSNLELIQAAQRMLARLGIISNINGPYRGKEYNLYIPAQHSDVFMERVGFANTRKSDTFYSKPRIYAAREKDFTAEVVELTYIGIEEVFDVSVEEIHALDANGIYVHNCVVAGNVRRSAEIALGAPDDKDFLDLKNWEVNPDRMGANGWGHTSNNSIIAEVGGNYDTLAERIAENGEPGLLYLDLCRKYGRLIDPPNNKDYRVAGTNPCAEQSLESGECCVTAETLIQTRYGIAPIGDLVGIPIEVWNGENWSEVTPFSTGHLPTYRITLSDGSILDASEGHEWLARKSTQRVFHEIRTSDLEVGMYLPEFELSNMGGKPVDAAYEWGWFAGDGFIDDQKALILIQENGYSVIESMKLDSVYSEQTNGQNSPFRRASLRSVLPLDIARILRNHDEGLPQEVLAMDPESISNFVAGWIDTDGSVIRQENTDHYVLYGDEKKLRDLQILLRRIGVNHSTLRLFSSAGTETNKGIRNQDLWRILIPSYESAGIPTRVKVATRFGTRFGVNNRYPASQIDRARKQKIVSIDFLGSKETYCFDEPVLHRGVFGNVLTKQCTLVETFPVKHDSLEDYKRTIKVAYLYAKSVTLLPTHWPETNSIMQRNRRIGCSISGVAQFAERYGWAEMKTWLNDGYNEVQRYDVVYSDWLGVRESIKMTSVKPSGCQKPDTMVTAMDGLYMLGELGNIDADQWQYLGKAVFNETTDTNKATHFFVNGLANTKLIKLKSGLTLESTPNHQYKVLTPNGLEWRRADALKEGDTLPYSVGEYLAQETNMVRPHVPLMRAEKPYCNVREMAMPEILTEDLAWLLGLMTGDGSVHTKGIRIAGSVAHLDHLERAAEIVEELFGLSPIIYFRTKSEQNADLYINSTWFREWLHANDLFKPKSSEVLIPLKIRQSPVSVIEAFLDGYCAADGNINHLGRTFVTINKLMAEQVVCVLRAIGHDASMREMPPTDSSWGSNMRYWVQEKKGRLGQTKKLPTKNQQDLALLDKLHLVHMMPDYIVSIEDGYNMTVDIEVPDGNTYIANSYISHNTVSLLFGVTPGVHWPTADVYIRRMRLASNDPLLSALEKAGYHTEPDVMDPVHSVVVELPTRGPQVRTEREVTMWEKASLAVLAQRYWADNQVSVTITFQPHEKDQIGALLRSVDGQLKSISMLPLLEDGGAYAQMPYERISEEVWEESTKKVKAIKWASLYAGNALDAEGEKFCSNDVCEIPMG